MQETGRWLVGAVGAYDWIGTVLNYNKYPSSKDYEVADNDDIKEILVGRSIESYLGML